MRPAIAKRMMHYFALMARPAPLNSDPFLDLTERERKVLALIAQGRNNAEITATLVLSPKTTRNYISNILNKLQVVDRAAAIIRARQAGLG